MDGKKRYPMSRWAILGCGYVGRRLASRLLRGGQQVSVSSRSDEGRVALATSLPGAEALCYQLGDALAGAAQYDVVVISCPPEAEAPAAERALGEQLSPAQRLLYLSTSGVYAPGEGREVADDYLLGPGAERSERRLRVEKALVAAHANTACLRIAAIYGPSRGVHARMRRGDYRLIGAAKTLVARIFVDDLVDAIELLGETKDLAHTAYVIGDEEPTTALCHAKGIAERLGLPMPLRVEESEVSPAVRAMLGADRRIVPRRLHALGWRAKHRSWREGLEACLLIEAEQAQN
ncbi:MAG: NAD(P)-binding domain-containing protein [Myxococcales bacterium]|nr:NAD(P)-binding domain-containing protein [Myxococcales bacterium]